MANEI
jgi:hypothetical protein